MDSEIPVIVGKNIRRLRTGKGLSQEKLADASGCHRNYIGLIERGERNPTIAVMAAIASALGCDIDVLLQDEQSGAPQSAAGDR